MKPLLRFIKNWSLPLAMITGVVFYRFFDKLSPVIPSLIFIMLLLTFSRIRSTPVATPLLVAEEDATILATCVPCQ